jgi:AcrR family transcriptional regulator
VATRISLPSGAMRKLPRQARALATTDAILDAAAHILGERGWLGLTTNGVAEAAGVSIGSLYQYFPNKLALIEAVRRRHFDDVLAVLQAASDPKTPRSRRIAALVEGMIAVHSRYPAAYRVLLEECPRGEDARRTHDFFAKESRKNYEAVYDVNARRARDPTGIGASLLAGAVAGAVHEAARRSTLDSTIVKQELLTMVEAYLDRRQPVALPNLSVAKKQRLISN